MTDDNPDLFDLSPDWAALTEVFARKAREARKQGNDRAHVFWTSVAEQADAESLTKRQVYEYTALPADVAVTDNE